MSETKKKAKNKNIKKKSRKQKKWSLIYIQTTVYQTQRRKCLSKIMDGNMCWEGQQIHVRNLFPPCCSCKYTSEDKLNLIGHIRKQEDEIVIKNI